MKKYMKEKTQLGITTDTEENKAIPRNIQKLTYSVTIQISCDQYNKRE